MNYNMSKHNKMASEPRDSWFEDGKCISCGATEEDAERYGHESGCESEEVNPPG